MSLATTNFPFQSVETHLHKLVNLFHRKYGGDFQEMLQETIVYLLEHWHTYNAKRSSVVTWTCMMAKYSLLSIMSRNIDRYKRYNKFINNLRLRTRPIHWRKNTRHHDEEGFSCTFSPIPKQSKPFSLNSLEKEISGPSADIIEKVMEPPLDVIQRTKKTDRHLQRRMRERGWRKALVKYLIEIGWSPDEILKSWHEIREAIQ
jgi:hypothetical protein